MFVVIFYHQNFKRQGLYVWFRKMMRSWVTLSNRDVLPFSFQLWLGKNAGDVRNNPNRYDCLLSTSGGSTSYCIFCWYHWLWRISNNLWIEHVSGNFSCFFFFDKFDFLFLKFEQDQIQKRRSTCAVRSFPDSTIDYNLSRNSLQWNESIMHSSKKTFISMKILWHGLGIWEKCSRTLLNIEPHDRFHSWPPWLVITRF